MSTAKTEIAWTDRTWNPVRGCTRVSPGCERCYAEGIAFRFSGPGQPFEGLARKVNGHPAWTGKVVTVESALLEPLSWRKPRRVFVNSMSDLFHEDVPFEFIAAVFAVMAYCQRHTFQVLTKRPERMLAFMAWVSAPEGAARIQRVDERIVETVYESHADGLDLNACLFNDGVWPPKNVWLGVSVENQHFADERIPLLLKTPAAVRFISAEPLLEKVLLDNGCNSWLSCTSKLTNEQYEAMTPEQQLKVQDCCEAFSFGGEPHFHGIDWVIVGGESGPKARPFDLAWARSIVQQCKAAGVPVFVKQLGARPIEEFAPGCDALITLKNRKGADMAEWPADLRVREFPVVDR